MKYIICFIVFFISGIIHAQDDIHIIDSTYPYKVVCHPVPYELAPGNYLFRDEIDYMTFLNSDLYNPILIPVFFSSDEMGLVLVGKSGAIDSVIETDWNIIVYVKVNKGVGYNFDCTRTGNQKLFVKLKKSKKEILVYEIIEERPVSLDYGVYRPY